ncbi:MAG: RsiV family protein [Bacteroidia bacterium]|nr:RsiV family protein [Bacteroidia bacterium]NNF30836.1 DUF3298 domain-containing protein [Flavobacteriaceae bacterium]MBT8275457.1 RsiV family protein [Bacteroidia bacterium]NNJ81024.1 DUF3298 domain-containing protein [Flavobacteriaceae bacterium]NNK54449.1 DUF3298 domain-containing protein [Flavobacteriaceae bacterium]
MKNLLIALSVSMLLFGCKDDPKKELTDEIPFEETDETLPDTIMATENDLDLQKQIDVEIRKKTLVEKEDERDELQDLIISKRFLRDEDLYTIDFKYPYLNENLKESYVNFNEYIAETYLDIAGVEAQILEDKELLCDTLRINKFREKRYVDYKVYNVNEKLVSVLFYKENFYSGTLHPSYTFDCLNFDLDRSVFMIYEDFFIEGSEEELRKILNEILVAKIESGEVYYDCWGISEEDFFEYKDNFVVDDKMVEYYFDDCVICPTYTGNFSVEIPLEELLPVLRRYNLNPLQL